MSSGLRAGESASEQCAGSTLALRRGRLVWHVCAAAAVRLPEWLTRQEREPTAARILKEAPGRRVLAAEGWVLKWSAPRQPSARWRFGLQPSAARRAFRLALELLRAGVPTAQPVAWATRRSGGLRREDFLITEELAGTEMLSARLHRYMASPAERVETLTALGHLAGALHRAGFTNRDLKDANLLCSRGEPLRIWVTDLDGVRRWARVPARRAAADLGPLCHSLRCHGWLRDAGDAAALLAAYNARTQPRLQRRTLGNTGRGP